MAPPPARGSDLALITFRASSVLDVSGRTVVGWSITDHLRTELVVDALDMARLLRKPVRTILRSERGTR